MPIIAIAFAVLVLDQLTKYYIQLNMFPGMSIPVIDEIFHITYILNPGAAFGILQHQRWFFVLVAVLLFAGLLYFYPRMPKGSRLLPLAAGLQAGGAAGNVVDRVKTGYVVDFLDFRIWPVFNIADMAIVCGVGLFIYYLLFCHDKKDELP